MSRRLAFRPPALLVLAAGASERHDGRPKALLEVDGQPAVLHILEAARDAGLAQAVVVVGRHRAEIELALHHDPARVAENPFWEVGRTGSVQVGLDELPDVSSVVLWPVDHPFVEANTLEALCARASEDAVASWLIPSFRGRGGHPVLIKRAAFAAVQALDPNQPLRAVLPRLGVQVTRVPVGDPFVLLGTDTPQEYQDALAQRRSLRGF